MLMKARVLDYINSTFKDINQALSSRPQGEICVKLNRLKGVSSNPSPVGSDNDVESAGDDVPTNNKRRAASRQVKYHWPGKTESEAWRFTCMVVMLHEVHNAVQSDSVVTKRDIYYRHAELFQKQDVVDRLVDDIAFTCGVTRHDLNVTASPKGLLCGIELFSIHQNVEPSQIHLVPSEPRSVTRSHIRNIRWVLVIEKEASFKTLVEAGFQKRCVAGPGLLITTKGYPDLNSWVFLKHLTELSNDLPVFSWTDSDPDGLAIHQCFVHPPKSLAGSDQHLIDLPITRLGVNIEECLDDKNIMSQCLPMSKRDRTRARTMLNRGGTGIQTQTSLQTMLILNLKMEIQAIDLVSWLNKSMLEMFNR